MTRRKFEFSGVNPDLGTVHYAVTLSAGFKQALKMAVLKFHKAHPSATITDTRWMDIQS